MRYGQSHKGIDVRVVALPREAVVEVQDYGPGIPAAELPNIFSRFYQGAESPPGSTGGLGLGLYIVREIVEAHGGAVEAESRVGEGTLFRFRLPLS